MKIKNSALSFNSGTVTIDPKDTKKNRGDNNLTYSKGAVNPASFNVTGDYTHTYAITLPSSSYTYKSVLETKTVIIDNFTSLPTGSGMLTSGTQTIFVGATIYFNAPLPINKKNYDGDFEIIINYN